MISNYSAVAEPSALAMPQSTSVVFVVDDDVSVRQSLELLIESAGWRVEAFGSAAEFLRRRKADAPSCLVLDVDPPNSERPRSAEATR